MSHIHIPDGIIPTGWWVAGYILTFIILYILLSRMKGEEIKNKIPLAGMVGAVMLIAMSVPLGFIPLHFSLAVLCGILLGPGLGFLVVFVVNVILALLGHGGATVVGLNTVVIGAEVLVGAYLFRIAVKKMKVGAGAALAAVGALIISVTLMLGVVSAATDTVAALSQYQCSSHSYGEEHDDGVIHYQDIEQGQGIERVLAGTRYFAFTGWGALLGLILTGIVLEAAATGLIARYLSESRPDLFLAGNGG